MADRQQRLRSVLRQRPKPAAFAARHQHDPVLADLSGRRQIGPGLEVDDPALPVDDRDLAKQPDVHQLEELARRVGRRPGQGGAVHDSGHRRLVRNGLQEPATDVAIGHGADQSSGLVTDQADLTGGPVEAANGAEDRRIGRQDRVLPCGHGRRPWRARRRVRGGVEVT